MSMLDKIRDALQRIPIMLVLLGFAGYFGYDYWSYMKDDSSPYIQAQARVAAAAGEEKALRKKVDDLRGFEKTIEEKRSGLRNLIKELSEMKNSIPESIDETSFLHDLETEAARTQITLLKKTPLDLQSKDLYTEVPFKIEFTGVYFRVLQFLGRLANLRQICQVTEISLSLTPVSDKRFVRLQGKATIRAYKYKSSQADTLDSKAKPPTVTPATAPAQPAAAFQPKKGEE